MQETECPGLVAAESAPVVEGTLQQGEGALDIGADEIGRPVQGSVHMRLGGEVHDGARAVIGQQLRKQGLVADIAVHELVIGPAIQTGQVVRISRIGQGIEGEHRLGLPGLAGLCTQPVENEICADEAGAACHKNHALQDIPLAT